MQTSWLKAGIQTFSGLVLLGFFFLLFFLPSRGMFLILKPRLISPSSFYILSGLGHPAQAYSTISRINRAKGITVITWYNSEEQQEAT